MANYRRNFLPGGSYFFTVNLVDRRRALLTDHVRVMENCPAQNATESGTPKISSIACLAVLAVNAMNAAGAKRSNVPSKGG
jgi:hypothetical protein